MDRLINKWENKVEIPVSPMKIKYIKKIGCVCNE